MALTKITKTGITDAAVEREKIKADAIDATKLADDAVSEEHLDVTAITGNPSLSASAATDDVLLVYDTSSGLIKKITAGNVGLQAPTISTVSPSNVLNGDGTGNHTFVITGTGYLADATAKITTNGGTDITFDTVTRNSATQLTGVVAKSKANLTNANEPFDITVTVAGALAATKSDAFTIDASPVYVTGAGTLGTLTGGSAMSTIDIVATDPESAGNVSFELQSGTLPAGVSSATVNENGVSKFRITGTPTNPAAASTTSNFVLRAVDAASNTTSRAFSITVNRTYTRTSYTSSGTFTVPTGATAVNVLVVGAGGGSQSQPSSPAHRAGSAGGGAGGLIYMPGVPVTSAGTVVVTVGDGAGSAGEGQDSVFGGSPSPGTTEVLTAKGGGRGGSAYNPSPGGYYDGYDGGSGGGANGPGPAGHKSVATQPTQPGNSGAYGFGNPGGAGVADGGGGGGGAGAAGSDGPSGNGGVGKAYTIADGTTSVFYAGGGAGGPGGTGGQGGGGNAGMNPGTANRGGGAGGSSAMSQPNVGGAKGIVIVEH